MKRGGIIMAEMVVKRVWISLVFVGLAILAFGQKGSLFDDSKVSTIHITIPPDSLKYIMENVLSDHYFMARFVFDDGVKQDTVDSIGFRLRGNTSRYSRKKSFKISFNEYVQGRRYQEVKKINLNGSHNDPTMIREKLFYEVWKRAGFVERRTSFVKLFINGIYYGLYTNLEEMDKDWLKRTFPEHSGNLFKCTYPADLVYHGSSPNIYKNLENSTVTGGRVYDLQTNEAEDDYTHLVALITALNQPHNSSFESNLESVLDVDYYLKAFALDVATGNWDDYSYNRNNFYLYDDPTTGRFFFISYDADNTFGVDWMNVNWAARNCLQWTNTEFSLPMAQRLMQVPTYVTKFKHYLDTITTTVLNLDTIFARIDSMHVQITPAAIADPFRTLDFGYTVQDFHDGFIKKVDNHTPYGIKPFLSLRKSFTEKQLLAAGEEELAQEMDVSIFPNPTANYLFIQSTAPTNSPIQYSLTDLSGKIVQTSTWNPASVSTFTLDMSSLSSGLYLLHLTSKNKVWIFKVTKSM